MKKIQLIIVSFVFVLVSQTSLSQWNFNGNHIYNINSGNVGIVTSSPQYLFDVAAEQTEPTIAVRNLGSNGGAAFRFCDQNSNSDWKIKTIFFGGFKIRDQQNSLDVITIENNTASNCIYIEEGGNIGIGNTDPISILDIAKATTEPLISIRNLGSNGGAGFRLVDQNSGSDWKIKTIYNGGFKIHDQTNSLDVITIENNTAANSMYIKAGGNIGIGNSDPISLLDVAKSSTEPMISVRNLGSNGGAGFRMVDQLSNSDWKIKSIFNGGLKIRDEENSLNVITIENNSAENCIYIESGGNIGIGTSNPSSKLAVNGKIDCKQVEITLDGWSDYVFDDNYELLPIHELEKFVRINNHLPDIPTEEDILENGLDVGEMNKLLLKKIEELSLYIIEIEKNNKKLEERLLEIEQLLK